MQTRTGRPADERQDAIACFERGDHAEASRRLVSLLARIAPDPLLLRLCGMALLRAGAAAQGLPYLATARQMAPQDPVAALWLGIALQATGHFEMAVEALQAGASLAPDDPAPLIHLSRTLMRLHRPDQAVAAAQRAMGLAPALPEAEHALRLTELVALQASGPVEPEILASAWLQFGLSCLRLDSVLEARAALDQALVTQPLHAEAAAWMGFLEHLCGEPVTAIARLRGVLDRSPGCVTARLHLASRMLLHGDAADALRLLEEKEPPEPAQQARALAWRIVALVALGRQGDAQAALAGVAGSVGDTEIVLLWQQSLVARAAGDQIGASALVNRVACLASDRNGAQLEDRLEAQFRLAGLYATTGHQERAFNHWRQGHALLRMAQPFSRETHLATRRAVAQAFGRDRLVSGPRAEVADTSAVFIVGLPRTGTTLCEQILAAHPLVHGAGERLAIRETLVRLTGTTDAALAAGLAASLSAETLTAAARSYLEELKAEAPGARIVLDKMPDNFGQLGFIATLLPGARVICCTRDLRDVGASIFQQRFLGHHPYAHDLADLGWYMARHQEMLAHWQAVLTIPMLVLDHADWIANFDATLRRVLAFLDLPWDPACSQFFEQERTVRTASREQVRQPVNARGVGRWRPYATQLAPMLHELQRPG